MRSKLFVVVGALLALLALTGTALAANGGFGPVQPESPNAQGITTSFWFITAFVLAILVLVEGLLIAFIVRYRRRRSRARDAEGAQIHGSSRLETMWTVGPVLVLFAIAAFIFFKLPGIENVPSATASGGRLDVKVVGHQFYWEFAYPNGVVAIDQLRAPLGEPVKLTVTAPDTDVIHSWYIPALGGKMDAIPGRINTTWFQAESVGTYKGQCAELCGIQHAAMTASVQVLPKDEFDAWLAQRKEQQDAGSSPLGREQWEGVCAKCHGLAAEGNYGSPPAPAGAPPALSAATLSDSAQVETIVRNGRGNMPAVGSDWSDAQMDALTAYLKEKFR